MSPWAGIINALVTPFTVEGEIDLDGYRSNIRHLASTGIHGVIALATAGEAPSMSLDERKRVLVAAIGAAAGSVPVLAGVGGVNERETYEMIRFAEEKGASGLFVITPYFYRFTRQEYVAYFRRVASRSALPLLIYNSTYAETPLDPETIEHLAEIPTFVALKEGNQLQASEVIRRVGERVAVFTARDVYMFELLAVGGAGAICFTSNVAPQLCVALYHAVRSGQGEEARAIQHRLNPLVWQLVRRSYPAPLKAAMNMIGLAGGHVRLPLTDLREDELLPLREVLGALGLLQSAKV